MSSAGVLREDRFTSTPEDAAAYERARGDYGSWDDGRPTAGELAEDAYLDRLNARNPRPPDPRVQHMLVASQLRVEVARAVRETGAVAPGGAVFSIEGLVPDVVRVDGIGSDHPVLAWLERSPRWEVLVREGVVFVRPSGMPVATDEPPF